MSRSRSFALVLGLAAVGLALLPSAAPAQGDEFRTGTHVLRRLLHERKFKALNEWQDAVDDPNRTLLILFGKPTDDRGQWRWRVPGGLGAFVRGGGAVLLATDHGLRNDEVGRIFGFLPVGDRVSALRPGPGLEGPIDKEFIYRGLEGGLRDCIKVEATEENDPPLFRDNKLRVVTNRASSLRPAWAVPNVHILAQFPRGCWYVHGRGDPEKNADPKPFAVSREVGKSRLLMLADHSVFINEMLLQEKDGQPDNGNLDFTYDAIEWLRDQRRDRVLIIEDGEIQSELEVPLAGVEFPFRRFVRDVVTRSAGDFLKELEKKHQQEHHLDEMVIEGVNQATGRFPFGRANPQNYYLVLIILGVGGLVLFGLSRLVRASHRGNLAPVFDFSGVRPRTAGSTLAIREGAALAGDDLREYAREAASEWFGNLPGCPADPRGAKPPRVEARGGWWRRSRLRGEVRTLWRLASGKPAPRMSQKEFGKLLTRLEVLRGERDAGELKIEW